MKCKHHRVTLKTGVMKQWLILSPTDCKLYFLMHCAVRAKRFLGFGSAPCRISPCGDPG